MDNWIATHSCTILSAYINSVFSVAICVYDDFHLKIKYNIKIPPSSNDDGYIIQWEQSMDGMHWIFTQFHISIQLSKLVI